MKTLLLSLSALLVALAVSAGAARADVAPPPIVRVVPVKPITPASRLAKVDGWNGVALGATVAQAKAALRRAGLSAVDEKRGEDGVLSLVGKRGGATITVTFDEHKRVKQVVILTEQVIGRPAATKRLEELTSLWGVPEGPRRPVAIIPVPKEAYTWRGGGADVVLTLAGDDTQMFTVYEVYLPKVASAGD